MIPSKITSLSSIRTFRSVSGLCAPGSPRSGSPTPCAASDPPGRRCSCTAPAGGDRSSMISGMLLDLAGATAEAILDDYAAGWVGAGRMPVTAGSTTPRKGRGGNTTGPRPTPPGRSPTGAPPCWSGSALSTPPPTSTRSACSPPRSKPCVPCCCPDPTSARGGRATPGERLRRRSPSRQGRRGRPGTQRQRGTQWAAAADRGRGRAVALVLGVRARSRPLRVLPQVPDVVETDQRRGVSLWVCQAAAAFGVGPLVIGCW
jgi:hypothetical protein